MARAAVEDLKIGDLVVTASGALRKIVWIGTRAYSPRFASNNPDLLPIRFRAGSLDYGVGGATCWFRPNTRCSSTAC